MTDKPYTVGYGHDKKYYVNGCASVRRVLVLRRHT